MHLPDFPIWPPALSGSFHPQNTLTWLSQDGHKVYPFFNLNSVFSYLCDEWIRVRSLLKFPPWCAMDLQT